MPPRAFAFEGGLASELFYSHRGAEIAQELVEPSVRTRWNTRSDMTILIDDFEFESVDESFLESLSLRGDGYRFDGEGFASFAHTYGAYATRPSYFLNRSRALRLSSPGPLPGRLVIELTEPMTLSCGSSLSARIRVLDPRLLSAEGVPPVSAQLPPDVILAVGMSDADGEARVELAAMIGPGGFGRTYTQFEVPMSALGCEGEGLGVEEFFIELNNIDVMIDDLRIVER